MWGGAGQQAARNSETAWFVARVYPYISPVESFAFFWCWRLVLRQPGLSSGAMTSRCRRPCVRVRSPPLVGLSLGVRLVIGANGGTCFTNSAKVALLENGCVAQQHRFCHILDGVAAHLGTN